MGHQANIDTNSAKTECKRWKEINFRISVCQWNRSLGKTSKINNIQLGLEIYSEIAETVWLLREYAGKTETSDSIFFGKMKILI